MKKYHYLTAAALLISLGVLAAAGIGGQRFDRGPDRVGFLGILRFVHLDAQEVQQIETILKNNEAQIESDRKATTEARCAYEQGVITGSSDLTTLLGNFTTAQANETALHTTILQEIAKVLTSEQISTIAAASCTPK
ncbi:MAG TPA: hypothetical protein VI756_12755 [Blastocatellia bacterium]